MKNAIVLTALFLSATLAHAKTVCNVNTSTKNDMTFDRILLTSEVAAPKFLVQKKGSAEVSEIEIASLNSREKWLAIDGATLIVLSPQEKGTFSISLGRVNAKNEAELFTIDSMASGPIAAGQYLHLMAPRKNLSLVCAGSN